MNPELRRSGPTDLSDVGEDADLATRIRTEIRQNGPMPFDRFMDLALYDPEGGYYRAAHARPGRGGDFLTAPELHLIFGATLAVAIEQIWDRLDRPDPFVVREHGAGDGALAVTLLAAVAGTAFGDAVRYDPIEVDPRRVKALSSRLAHAGLDAMLAPVGMAPSDGVVLANEVLDALPVHRVRRRGDRLVELAVEVDGDDALVEVEIEPTTQALAARLVSEDVELVDGQTAEICLGLDDWIAAAVPPLRHGALLLIDYGAPAADLYDPIRRRGGTLRAYVRHQVHADPYRHIGRQDLTAHVDVTAVERAAHAAGLTTIGITTQAEALIGLGIQERLQAIQADPATTIEEYTLLRSALMRLLDPAAMGRFRVMAFGRGWPDSPGDPAGDASLGLFAFRLPSRGRRRP